MNVRLTEQLIELNAVVKPSRREFKFWSGNIYIEIIVLFISLLVFIIIFIVHVLFYLSTVSFRWYVIFFPTLRYIRIKYIRIHEQIATTW